MRRLFLSGTLFVMGVALSAWTAQAQTDPSGQTSTQKQSGQSGQGAGTWNERSPGQAGQSTGTMDQQSPTGGMDRSQPSTTDKSNRSSGRTSGSMSGSANRSASDSGFLAKAVQGGMAEIEFANLAQQKASSSAVKNFAQKMITDHTQANEKLKEIAQKENVTLPATISAKDQSEKARLENMSGADFDRAYMARMVGDHEKDVKEFQKEAKSGKDPEVKDFASQTVPKLQEHLSLARQTHAQVKSGSSSSMGSASRSSSSSSGSANRSTEQNDSPNKSDRTNQIDRTQQPNTTDQTNRDEK